MLMRSPCPDRARFPDMILRLPVLLLVVLLLGGCSPSRGIYHTVEEGQTLYRISRTYGVDERHLARINRLDDPTRLRAGQRLFIPDVDRVRRVQVSEKPSPETPRTSLSKPTVVKTAPPPLTEKKQVSAPAAAAGKTSVPKKPAISAPVPARTTAVSLHAPVKGKFLWPLAGEVVRRFGEAGDPPCKGLEIAVARGTPVLSAAAGRVIYSGDGIRSYGNLVILKHDDDFFTVYGFNDNNMVKAGTFVSKGDRLALSGAPPAGGTPRLYFEIRHGKDPVNPIFYLP